MIAYQSLSQSEYEALRFESLLQLEGGPLDAYADSVGIATIGIGFNLRNASVREPLFEAFGIDRGDADDDRYADRLTTELQKDWDGASSALRASLNSIMAERAGDPSVPGGASKRSEFAFLSNSEMVAFFNAEIVDQFEGVVDDWLPGVPLSVERAAYLSLAYNGIIQGDGFSPNLNAAVEDGDRAEAWFEIRYNTNGGASRSTGIAKRRYVESHLHSLYDDVDGDGNVSELQALQVFRMFTKHENRILQEEDLFGDPAGDAIGDLAVIESRSGLELGSVEARGASFQPAEDKLVANFAALPGLIAAQLASIAADTALVDLNFGGIFVAPSSAASGEVAANTVDRAGDLRTHLIFGAIEQDGGGADSLLGGTGADHFIGGSGADTMNGDAGEDTVDYRRSGAGVDVNLAAETGAGGDAAGDRLIAVENLIGSNFADQLRGTAGGNILIGEGGADALFAEAGDDTLFGGAGDDEIFAAAGADRLYGGEGADELYGGDGDAGADSLFGEAGGDLLIGGGGADLLDGGSGPDKLSGDAGDDSLFGGAGVDSLIGGDGADFIDGGLDADRLFGRAGADTLSGGPGADLFVAQNGADSLIGGDGADTLYAGQGDAAADTLSGGEGADLLLSFAGNDFVAGDGGADKADAGEGADTILGGTGDDTLFGRLGADRLEGGDGNDQLSGNQDGDTLFGGEGDDDIFAQFGDDFAAGGPGDDILYGGRDDGNDTLAGGTGADTLFGFGGADQFNFADGDGSDILRDFDGSEDRVRLSGFGSAFDSFAEVQAAASAAGADVVIDFGDGDRLTLANTSLGALEADDFFFA